MNLPPNIRQYISIYSTIKNPKKFLYLSTPITTGPRYFAWYAEEGKSLVRDSEAYKKSHKQKVLLPNIEDSKKEVDNIYSLTVELIINPAVVELPLTQEEYMLLWSETITNFVSKVVFAPGWQYSKGALLEYITCLRHRIPTLDNHLNEITIKRTLESLDLCKSFLNSVGLKSDFQENIYRLLKNV